MKNWLYSVMLKLNNFMRGRYGMDELSRFLDIAAIIFMFLSWIPYTRFLIIVSFILITIVTLRTFSKDFSRRRLENIRYLNIAAGFKGFFTRQKRRWADRKTHKYFKCSKCGKFLRVPRGKGKISIKCPSCGTEIIKKT